MIVALGRLLAVHPQNGRSIDDLRWRNVSSAVTRLLIVSQGSNKSDNNLAVN